MPQKKLIKRLAIFVIALFTVEYAAAQTGKRYLHPIFAAVDILSNRQYGSAVNYRGQNEKLVLDFYQPRGDPLRQRPLVIYVHGGGFKEGLRTQEHIKALCDSLARRGYVAASIDYRLVDTLTTVSTAMYRASIDAMHDAKAAVRYFRRNAAMYMIDTTKIFIGGESAGGMTAAHVAYIDKLPEIDPRYVSLHSVEGNSGNAGHSSSVAACLELCGFLWYTTVIERPSDPRLFVAHGTADDVVNFNNALEIVKRAENVGLVHTLLRLEGAKHCPWSSLWPGYQAYLDTLVQQVALFLYPKVVTSVQERASKLPATFELGANHPNPFNPSTTITYALPHAVEVKLVIYDMLGRRVRTLVNQRQQAGRYAITWDGRNKQGQAVASGIFIYQFHAGDPSAGSGQAFVQTRRMALVR